jgi:hypothetical protein
MKWFIALLFLFSSQFVYAVTYENFPNDANDEPLLTDSFFTFEHKPGTKIKAGFLQTAVGGSGTFNTTVPKITTSILDSAVKAKDSKLTYKNVKSIMYYAWRDYSGGVALSNVYNPDGSLFYTFSANTPNFTVCGIYLSDLDYKDNNIIYANVTVFHTLPGIDASLKYPITNLGTMRIDNMKFESGVTNGMNSSWAGVNFASTRVFFFYGNTDIKGTITSDKKAVRPGEKVNISWSAEKK